MDNILDLLGGSGVDGGTGGTGGGSDPAVAANGTANNKGTGNGGSDDFMSQLQSALMSSSGMVSSENSDIENTLNSAVANLNKSNDASKGATTLDYKIQEDAAAQKGQNDITSVNEASRGYAVNTGLLKNMNDTMDKQINDLEERKQQALLTADATTANNIAALQFQALQMKNDNTQKIFTNLISAAGVIQNQQQINNAAKKQSFDEQSTMTSLALKYGLSVNPGDTLSTITQRAMPLASKEEQLNLKQIQASIDSSEASAAASRAAAQKSLSDAAAGSTLSSDDIDNLATTYNRVGGAILANIKDPTAQSTVIQRAAEMKISDTVNNLYASGLNPDQVHASIVNNANMSSADKALALTQAAKAATNIPAAIAAAPNKPFTAPGSLPAGGLAAVKPANQMTPAEAAKARAALVNALKGTALGR